MKPWINKLAEEVEQPITKKPSTVKEIAEKVRTFINKIPYGASDRSRGIDFIGGFVEQLVDMNAIVVEEKDLSTIIEQVYNSIMGKSKEASIADSNELLGVFINNNIIRRS